MVTKGTPFLPREYILYASVFSWGSVLVRELALSSGVRKGDVPYPRLDLHKVDDLERRYPCYQVQPVVGLLCDGIAEEADQPQTLKRSQVVQFTYRHQNVGAMLLRH